jgi:hypothetical protein
MSSFPLFSFLLIIISLLLMFSFNSTEPSFFPCLNKAEPERSFLFTPNKANSIANRIVDLPEPISPDNKTGPVGKSICWLR